MKFPSIRIEGAILAADILDKIEGGVVVGQKPVDFGLATDAKVKDEIVRAWADAQDFWRIFRRKLDGLKPEVTATTETRNFFIVPLLGLQGYQVELAGKGEVVNEKNYPISHRVPNRDGFPIHVMGWRDSLDKKREDSGPRMSPHALVQEYLNLTQHLYAIVTNGQQLRLLRDSSRLIKLSFLEFDLRRIFEEELFPDFALLYRLLHVSRMPVKQDSAAESIIERYHQDSLDSGSRIRDGLSEAVEASIVALANGFLNHQQNQNLKDAVVSGDITAPEFYKWQLRLIYRLLFLMVIEERDLIFPKKSDRKQRDIYYRYYSLSRLRKLSEKRHFADKNFQDAWAALTSTFRLFEANGPGPKLGIAPLDGDLFGHGAIGQLNDVALDNATLLGCFRNLSIFEHPDTHQRIRVNYGALNVEEFGSVYEGLLEYDPVITPNNNRLEFSFVQGEGRASSGSHYTPDELVQPLIQHSLDYLIEDKLKEKDKEPALLSLRVCDIACGSGHILLNAARRIATELAIIRTGEDQPSPLAFREAVRDVIRHCIYGVDLNPLAVELCKVALWLEAHVPGESLNFLDHHIKCGNSIVGLANELELQRGIPDEAFNRLPDDDKDVASEFRKRNKAEKKETGQQKLDLAQSIRQELQPVSQEYAQLAALPDHNPTDYEHKKAQFEGMNQRKDIWRLRTLANLQVAQFFLPKTPENKPFLCTEEEYGDYLTGKRHPQSQAVAHANALAIDKDWHFFHWFIEFPDIFERGGFDCILGNPPYLGAQKFSQMHGRYYFEWLSAQFEGGGLADLIVYFVRRIYSLIRKNGYLALIGTSSLSRGDSRTVGLSRITQADGVINFVVRKLKWPGLAATFVALFSVKKGSFTGIPTLDGRQATVISSYFDDDPIGESKPLQLLAKANKSFIGSNFNGDGFIVDERFVKSCLQVDKRYQDVLFKNLLGADVNTDPRIAHSRWIICFFDWEREKAEQYPLCFERVEMLVKPHRQSNSSKSLREKWWIYERVRKPLYEAIRATDRVLVRSQAGKHNVFEFVDSDFIFDQKVVAFALQSFADYAVLNSSLHEIFVWRFSGDLGGTTTNYSPEIVFDTFPIPESESVLESLGERYHEHRRELMLKLQLGLTKTYNLFHDRDLSVELVAKESKQPVAVAESAHADFLQLRALHVQMDQAVLAAYGWHQPSDAGPAIALRHDFYEVDYLPENDRVRYTIHPDVRKEILKRLLQLNHKIYAEEEAKGLHQKKSAKTTVALQPGASDLPLFRVLPPTVPAPVKTPSLPEVVARFNFVLPSRQRPRVNSTAEFYLTLIPALVQEAGEKLVYLNLVEAMSFLASPPATASSLPAPAASAFSIWRTTFPSSLVDPNALQAALHDLIVMRHSLNVRREQNGFLLFKGIQWTAITFDWTLLDARMALSHAASAGAALPPWLAVISDGDLQHWATA